MYACDVSFTALATIVEPCDWTWETMGRYLSCGSAPWMSTTASLLMPTFCAPSQIGIEAVLSAARSAPTRKIPWRSFATFFWYQMKRPTRALYVSPVGSEKSFAGAVIGNETGDACSASQRVTTGTSGRPVFWPLLSGQL